ncbi:hypothetical protein ABZ442_20225 [Streptomyces triculaminicus]|uniref:hypothetical protein n=1 Tax=Streptomyces triculaminicus TaxID=2816232 RepID=UPI003405F396
MTGSGLVPADELFAHAAEQITRAAGLLWCGETVRLGIQVRSVTGYVQQIRVGERDLYAKVSYLGVSLVSVLRGTCGDWRTVRAAQAAYIGSPDALLRREAAQLGLLHQHSGLQTAVAEGFADGVLFTHPVPGPTLADLVAKEPSLTTDLLTTTMREVDTALDRPRLAWQLSRLAIRERGIDAVFTRKFNGLSGRVYLDLAGEMAALLAAVVTRLRRLHFAEPTPGLPAVTAYGDLKPEHVCFPGGPEERPVFLDPGLSRSRAATDEAKLISRMVLGLIAFPSDADGVKATVEGIDAFTEARTAGWKKTAQAAWLRQLLVLWLMDTVNILTTYLTAPAGLPLPDQGLRVAARAEAVGTFLDRVSAALEAGREPRAIWRLALDTVVEEAAR